MRQSLCLQSILWTVVLLFTGTHLRGQNLVESLHLDMSDGLSQNTVSALAEDVYGRIWIATPLGLHWYDGKQVSQVHGLEQNIIHLKMLDTKVIALSTSSISSIDIHTMELVEFDFPQAHYYTAKYLPTGVMLLHQKDLDSLFLGFDLKPKAFPDYNDHKSILKLFSDSLLAIGEGTLVRNSRGVNWIHKDTLLITHANSAAGIKYDQNRSFVCSEDGLFDLESIDNELIVRRHFASFRSQSILVDSGKNLWIGTADQGVFAIHRNLVQNQYYNLRPDDEHNVSCWGGIDVDGEMYALTGNGIKSLSDENKNGPIEIATNRKNITSAKVAPEFILLGTGNEGLFKLKNGQLSSVYFNENTTLDNTILQIIEHNKGYLACTKFSFILMDSEGSYIRSIPYSTLGIGGYIMSLDVLPKKYVASTTKGVVHLTLDLNVVSQTSPQDAQIISSSTTIEDDHYYASYGGGLYIERENNLVTQEFPDKNLLEIESLSDSILWISSTTAVYRKKGEFNRKFNSENGFPILENSQNGMLNRGNGEIMLCGINGVFIFDDKLVSESPQIPQITLRIQGKTIFPNQEIHAPAESENMNIEIVPISILNKSSFTYSYEYLDNTEEFSGASFFNIATLTGETELKVLVKDLAAGRSHSYVWSITRPIPFWLTVWFKLAVALVVLLLVLGLVGLVRFVQTRKILRREQADRKVNDERLRISAELHDNIGARLTHIISSLDIELYKKKGNSTQLETINAFARDTMSQLRETIWAVSDRTIFFSEFAGRVEQYAVQCNTLTAINISCIVDEFSDFELNPVQTINLYRIIQEAINNAVKYSEASEIIVRIWQADEHIKISTSDNGAGFDLAKLTYGTGLSGMKTRAEEAHAQYEITSSKGRGTTISLAISRK